MLRTAVDQALGNAIPPVEKVNLTQITGQTSAQSNTIRDYRVAQVSYGDSAARSAAVRSSC